MPTSLAARRSSRPLLLLAGVLAAGCVTTSGLARYQPVPAPADSPESCRSAPPGRVTLPADDGMHEQPVEWWYWTGHLKTDDGRWFGFEEVFFRGNRRGTQSKMAHLAVTDIAGKSFHHDTVVGLGDYRAPPGSFDLGLGRFGAIGGGGRDHLHGSVDQYRLDLDLTSQKAPVLQHEGGYTAYTFGGDTYYYSRERMAVEGTLTVDGAPIHVTGTAWFDHQYGDLFKAAKIGWDWFALQLDDGQELMLFVVRDPSGPVLVGGSLSDQACKKTELSSYQVAPLGSWVSPHTGCTYPMGWRVAVAGKTYEIHPVLEDQELYRANHSIYWEGAATVTGDATGRAYVELTGYCRTPQKP